MHFCTTCRGHGYQLSAVMFYPMIPELVGFISRMKPIKIKCILNISQKISALCKILFLNFFLHKNKKCIPPTPEKKNWGIFWEMVFFKELRFFWAVIINNPNIFWLFAIFIFGRPNELVLICSYQSNKASSESLG